MFAIYDRCAVGISPPLRRRLARSPPGEQAPRSPSGECEPTPASLRGAEVGRFGRLAPPTKKHPPARVLLCWRRQSESDRRIKVLQTCALPLGYGAIFKTPGRGGENPPRGVRVLPRYENGHDGEIVPIDGADYGARTRHLHLGKVALYQMS